MNHELLYMLLGDKTPELHCLTAVVGENEGELYSRAVLVCDAVYLPTLSVSEAYEKLSKHCAEQADINRKIEAKKVSK